MNYKLNDFYRGKEWVLFRQQLIFERINEEGVLVCAYCGKPIINKYECIGHHKEPLTQKNVNDAAISLNPELVDLVHISCHNKVHEKLGHKEKHVYLVYGPPLAGKTTFVKGVAERGDLTIDMDSIWECISGFPRYDKPSRLTGIAFAVRDCLIEQVKYRNGNWCNAYVIGGYPLQGERERLCRSLDAKEIFIGCTQEECLLRLEKSGNGRDRTEWKEYISDWFRKGPPPSGN